jgi:hypothetical protein
MSLPPSSITQGSIGTNRSDITIQKDFEQFLCNLIAGGPSVLTAFSTVENSLNETAKEPSNIYGSVLAIQNGVDQLLGRFLDKFWNHIQTCPVGVRHRFIFAPRNVFTHEYWLIVDPTSVHSIELNQAMTGDQAEVHTHLEKWRMAIGFHRVLHMTVGRYSVCCTQWKVFHQEQEFVCEFNLST